MPGINAWVTYASGPLEALKAIVLARSLRRAVTRRMLIVHISEDVSESLRNLLRKHFDVCDIIGKESPEKAGLPFSMVSLLHCYDAMFLRKFAFVDCSSLFFKNADKIFLHSGFQSDGQTVSILVDSPSSSGKKALLKGFVKNGNPQGNVVKHLSSISKPLSSVHEYFLNFDEVEYARNLQEMRIVHFSMERSPAEFSFEKMMDESTKVGKSVQDVVSLYHGVLQETDLVNIIEGLPLEKLLGIKNGYKTTLPRVSLPDGFSNEDASTLADSVAIVGMSFRLPGANNLEEFWELLKEGREGIIKVPEGRWSEETCMTGSQSNFQETEAGFLSCPVDEMDAKFFGLSPKEVSYMDPQQRIVLELVWEALEHSCINPKKLKNSQTGVFGGWWRNDFKEILQEAGGLQSNEFFRTYMGNTIANVTSRISHVLELTGPSISTESGCSTSIVAVDMACKSLLNEDCDMALALGVNLFLHPFSAESFAKSIIAPDGRCKTFDASADGFGRAEGVTVLVLKRFGDAVRDNDRVWGLIRGTAVVQEGLSKSIGTPTVACEALAMKLALQVAQVDPEEVEFVETHGTGTPVGDPLEVAAIAEAYGKGRRQPLTIGSVKTNIGHTESCSGIAGIIKTLLVFQHETIPRHINFNTLNPDVNLDIIPANIPLSHVEWKRRQNGPPRLAGVSSFGITGTDAHAILQESPFGNEPRRALFSQEPPMYILKLSANSEEALSEMKSNYANFINDNEKLSLMDITYSANVGRSDMSMRTFGFGRTREELVASFAKGPMTRRGGAGTKICFLFTGQGSQHAGMAKELYDHQPLFRAHFDRCADVLEKTHGIRIKDAMWGEDTENLKRTIYSQTSIFVVEICLLRLWESWGIKPGVVVGHSLGEFAAAVAAGIISTEDALRLVATRSLLIDRLPQGSMLVIKADRKTVESLMSRISATRKVSLDFAAFNSDTQTVLAGSTEEISTFHEICVNNGLKSTLLATTHAFHSRHMDAMLDEYEATAKEVVEKEGNGPVFVSGMEGGVVTRLGPKYWRDHTRRPVDFLGASRTLTTTLGANLFLEVGPQPVLSALLSQNNEDGPPVTVLPSLRRNEDSFTSMLNSLGKLYVTGIDVDWEAFHAFSVGQKVTLPFYPFQRKKFPLEVDRPTSIHPLVGTVVSNPSDTKIFANTLSLEGTPFLRDHVIGGAFLFPGAGLVEMLLVGGYGGTGCLEGSYQPPVSPIALHDFQIEAPFALHEGSKTQVQVTLADAGGDTRVAVFSRLLLDKKTAKWVRHATANFLPLDTLPRTTQATIAANPLAEVRNRCSSKIETDKTYDELLKHGYKFGPTFQTLKAAWRNDQKQDEFVCEVGVTVSSDSHVMHPVMIDAMIQAVMLSTSNEGETMRLFVPVSISKFIWYKKITGDVCYIHRWNETTNGNEESIAVLYDGNGEKVAVMMGALLLETTISSIMINLESQKSSLPRMFEDVWRTQTGPNEKRIPPGAAYFEDKVFEPEFHKEMEKFNYIGGDVELEYQKANQLYLHYFLKAFQQLGWNFPVGADIQLTKLISSLSIRPELTKFTRYLLLELEKEGFLLKKDEDVFTVTKVLPPLASINSSIGSLQEDPLLKNCQEVKDVSGIAAKLGDILCGKVSSLPLLFPENLGEGQMGPAEAFYKQSKMHQFTTSTMIEVQPYYYNTLNHHLEANKGKSMIRILEVGAGTGSATEILLKGLTLDPSNYEYTYTDISPVFFKHGEKIFKDSGIKVIYKTLNIEEDVYSQGFIPHQYDFIAAAYVLHATEDTKTTLFNIQRLLAPQGTAIIFELCQPLRAVNILFGTLDGFSRFKDYELRKYNCELHQDKWIEVLNGMGFEKSTHFSAYYDHSAIIVAQNSSKLEQMEIYKNPAAPSSTASKSWIVFSRNASDEEFFSKKLGELNRIPTVLDFNKTTSSDVKVVVESLLADKSVLCEGIIFLWGNQRLKGTEDYPRVIESFLGVCKALSSYATKAGTPSLKLMVITSDILNAQDGTKQPPFSSVMFGMCKALQNENTSVSCRCLDIESKNENAFGTIVDEMFVDDGEFTVAYRGKQRNVPRFVNLKAPAASKSLPIPKSERFRLTLPSTNAVSDLRFSPANPPQLGDFDVEVRVKTYSMNFRDVLVILKPSKYFEDMTAVGYDFSGVITAIGPQVTKRKVGDEVIGFNEHNDSLPSHVRSSEDLLLPLPPSMTFAEAATLPAVVATVYACLVKVAQLKKEDTVLIHTGSGGVGLCAIQLAKFIGCKIVTTAGSERKRAYLRNLGVEYIYNSRTTDYEKQILKDVGGVDVVLNSLTSAGFKEATLAVCKPGARFIEMSKLNVWSNEDVKAIRPDVNYHLVDISDPTREEMIDYIHQVDNFCVNSNVKPLPYIRFEAADIREALAYMQKAKHIGKLIVGMPEPDLKGGWKANLFNEKSTYLITGGLGGIGLEIAKWMVSRGAVHVILAGRNPPNQKAQAQINEMNSRGANVMFRKCDVGSLDECKSLLDSIQSEGLPQLRGIMHAAGVLSDASYENQTWPKFQETFHPKVNGGWYLHELTLNYPLEHFVMFSSAAASLGSLGQANHSAANTFLDHLAFYRHSVGLPASTVNWGQWGQVGVAANKEVIGIKPFSTLQATSALELCMRNHQLQVVVCEADYDLWRKTFSSAKNYLQELQIASDSGKKSSLKLDGEVFWKEYDEVPEGPEKQTVVKKYLHLVIREVLHLGESDPLDDDLNFQDMGMDSLMMIEMKNLIQTILGERVKISIGAVKDCATINQMSNRIVQLVSGDDGEAKVPTRDELNLLIREDSALEEDIVLPENISVCKPSQIRTILLTGVTGNYGPFVLQDICRRPHVQKVYCVIRPHSNQTSTERLHRILREKGITDINLELITCLDGTIIDSKLGLTEEQYSTLSEEVDAVINLSVRAEILEYYKKSKVSENDARSVNVVGTKNVLRFACSRKLKHVYHASTMMTAVGMDKEGLIEEEWPRVDVFDHLPNSAYVTSKFISDLVIANAVKRGIPCKLFRLPFLGGDTKSGGNTDLMANHLVLRVMAYMYIGMMPPNPVPFPILPVDQAAELTGRLFFNDDTGYEVYNVCNPLANDETEITTITEEFGYKIDIVEPEVFFDKVENMENTEVAKLAKLTVQRQEDHMNTEASMPEMFLAWIKNRNIFLSRKMQRWIPEYPNCFESSIELLKKDLRFAKQNGIFEKVGLK